MCLLMVYPRRDCYCLVDFLSSVAAKDEQAPGSSFASHLSCLPAVRSPSQLTPLYQASPSDLPLIQLVKLMVLRMVLGLGEC